MTGLWKPVPLEASVKKQLGLSIAQGPAVRVLARYVHLLSVDTTVFAIATFERRFPLKAVLTPSRRIVVVSDTLFRIHRVLHVGANDYIWGSKANAYGRRIARVVPEGGDIYKTRTHGAAIHRILRS
jgi:hypothetical protein